MLCVIDSRDQEIVKEVVELFVGLAFFPSWVTPGNHEIWCRVERCRICANDFQIFRILEAVSVIDQLSESFDLPTIHLIEVSIKVFLIAGSQFEWFVREHFIASLPCIDLGLVDINSVSYHSHVAL